MENDNNIEVLLYSNLSLSRSDQKQFVEWLTTKLRPTIVRQKERAKKKALPVFKGEAPIYMS